MKKVNLPDFLLEMSMQLNKQNNRITAEPMFCVYYDEKISAADGYEDGCIYCDGDGEIGNFEDLKKYLTKNHAEFCIDVAESIESGDFDDFSEDELDTNDLPEGVFKWTYQNRPKFVKASLTEAGANQFIERKQHDYPKLYIYVESMIYCNQMIELRNWIKSITTGNQNEKS